MRDLTRRARAWAPVAKAAALFLLPAPLLLAAVVAVIRGDLETLARTGSAAGSLLAAGVLALRALTAEARYTLGERPAPPAVPLKLLSAVLTSLGAALAATAAGHDLASALVFAAIAALGAAAFYGRDLRPARIELPIVEGVDRNAVMQQLQEAHARLRSIEAASSAIAVPEFADRLDRIVTAGRNILAEIERDPRDASRARRFLTVYLDSAARVTQEYARTARQIRHGALDQNFRQLLIDMEHTFAEQHRKLLEHDVLTLDVEIEVLQTRLKRDGTA